MRKSKKRTFVLLHNFPTNDLLSKLYNEETKKEKPSKYAHLHTQICASLMNKLLIVVNVYKKKSFAVKKSKGFINSFVVIIEWQKIKTEENLSTQM